MFHIAYVLKTAKDSDFISTANRLNRSSGIICRASSVSLLQAELAPCALWSSMEVQHSPPWRSAPCTLWSSMEVNLYHHGGQLRVLYEVYV